MAKPKQPMKELGVATSPYSQGFNWDEYVPQLRGRNGIRKYREMRDNDPIIGAILMAMDMMLRAVEWRIEAREDSSAAEEAKEFVEGVFEDMEHTFPEFIAEVTTMIPFGFFLAEMVFKRRNGMGGSEPSIFDDGKVGIRKLASRAQWTIEEFTIDNEGRILGIRQDGAYGRKNVFIPADKLLHFRTVSLNDEPTGRSVLRNAYVPYHYANNIAKYEAIAVERELNGLPVLRIPSEYLNSDATDSQIAFRNQIQKLARDVKLNEQGYAVLPSDLIENDDGSKTSLYQVGFELIASQGTRDIDTSKVIMRHQQDMARVAMADFLMLGQGERGSFALSKSKSDLFLRSLEGYAKNIAAVLNQRLMPTLWELNGMPFDTMPRIVPGEVAPVDLQELGEYVKALSGSGIDLLDEDTQNVLREVGGLPEADIDDDMMGQADEVIPEIDEPEMDEPEGTTEE